MTREEVITLLQSRVDLIKKDYPDIADYAEALELAIEALNHFAGDSKKVSFSCGQENDKSIIYRQAAIDWLTNEWDGMVTSLFDGIKALPAAQPEKLTDKEQRIFLSAMGREEDVCKEVDDAWRDCREPYEDSLVHVCKEIRRKVKGTLWT